MKKPLCILLLSLSLSAPLSAFAFLGMNAGATLQGALPSWTKQIGTRAKKAATYGNAVTTDPSGNVIVAGYTASDLDGNTLTGTQDSFITKYNPTGTKLWTRQLGAAYQTTRASGVTTDTSGNIFVAGYTTGGLDGNVQIGSIDCFLTKYDSTGAKQWTKQLGVASNQTYGMGVSLDTSGNIFVAGYTSGGLDGNTVTGYRDFFVTKYDSTGTKLWTRQLGVLDSSIGTYAYGVAADSSGNVFVAGFTYGGLDGKTLIGTEDTFVTKYNSSGVKQWTQTLGVSSQMTQGQGVAVDPSGNVVVAGQTRGNLDGNTLSGSQDAFVTKYNTTGSKQWTKLIGTNAYGMGIATDSSGNIFLGGTTLGAIDGNTAMGFQDFFITKYDSTGAKQWTKELGPSSGSLSAYAYGIATDSSGNVAIAGYTNGGVDGNTLNGTFDFFVSKYSAAGVKQWTGQLGSVGPGNTSANAAATNTSGNLYISGSTDSGVDGNTQSGFSDFFVTKYNSTGTKLWTRQLGVASQSTYATAAATDSSGNVFVAGYTTGGLDGNTLSGSFDFFVTKYDSSGTKLWTKQMGVASKDTQAYALAADSSGNIFVAGSTTGGLDGNTRTGSTDLFVTKYDSAGTKLWTRQLGVASQGTSATAAATDSSGNVFVAGYTTGGLDGNTVAGYQDFFVTKYDSTGTKLWTKQMGASSAATNAQGAATDSSGNVFVAGYTSGGLDGNTLTGSYDFFVTKYDSTGTKLWTRQRGVASQDTYGNAAATDSSGNVFVAGYTSGGLDGNSLTGTQDFFVTKYTSAGVKQWTKQIGASQSTTNAAGIAMDSSGRLYVAGSTTRGIDFVSQIGAQDAFACQYIGN